MPSALHKTALALVLASACACERRPAMSVTAPPVVHLTAPPSTNLTDACVDRYEPAWDYFPDKVEFSHSIQLTVTYHGHYNTGLQSTARVDQRRHINAKRTDLSQHAP
jgi:hypothetical protein